MSEGESGPRMLRLVQQQVQVGQPLPFGVRDEHGKLLLARGQVVFSEAQLEVLLDRGVYVDAEEMAQARKQAEADKESAARRSTLFDLWEQSIWRLERVLKSLREPGLPERVEALARDFRQLVRRDPDIGLYMVLRQDPKRLPIYGLTHSLFTALACELLAVRLDLAEPQHVVLVKAALTMNLRILELQGRLATLGRRPSPAQTAELRAHPRGAADDLAAAGVTDDAWLQAVAQHHERRDGSGYPAGLSVAEGLPAVLRQVDVFMAKISPREGREALSVQDAERQLFAEEGGGSLAAALIKEFGIYPPGEFVVLKSGEMGVVVRRGPTVQTPLVAAITNRSGVPIVDTVRRDTGKPEFAVAGLARDRKLVLRVPPERLFGLPGA